MVIIASSQIRKADVRYDNHNTEKKMKMAVEEGLYPPSFLVDVTQNNCHSDCRALCTVTKLIIEGIDGENLCYSVKAEDVVEEVPGEIVCACKYTNISCICTCVFYVYFG